MVTGLRGRLEAGPANRPQKNMSCVESQLQTEGTPDFENIFHILNIILEATTLVIEIKKTTIKLISRRVSDGTSSIFQTI